MFVTNWISTTKIQKISEITNFFRHYFLSRTEVFNERIVELSFEFKAYTDVRRFRRGDLLNQPKQAIRWDSNQGGYVLKTLSEGNFWDDKLYLIPIYQEWLEKNPAWMDPEKQVDGRTKGQNPGW